MPDDLWQESPSAELLLKDAKVLSCNHAASVLMGLPVGELSALDDWQAKFFDDRNKKKLRNFLNGVGSVGPGIEIQSADGIKFVRIIKKNLADGMVLVSLQDMTETREDAQAFQAGYDEFIKVTMDLEDALTTIESQNKLLNRQKQILENELSIAHVVQAQLLSQDFSVHTLVNIAGAYLAMTELGGDMWEFSESEKEVWAVLGDVMGHGVASSLISIAAKSVFKRRFEEASQSGKRLGPLAGGVNSEMLAVTHGNYFLTACLVRISHDYQMEYLTAGHPPILYVPADPAKQIELLFTEQPMFGIFGDLTYTTSSIQLHPGDRMLLYTDCLIESTNAKGEVIDLLIAGEQMRYKPGTTAEDVIGNMLEFRKSFAGSDQLPDDLTLVCIEIPTGSSRVVTAAKRTPARV